MPPVAIQDECSSSFSVADKKHTSEDRKMRRRHSVDFINGHEAFEFEKPESQDAEEIWYTREEYDIMKARNSLIVKMMKSGSFRETDDHSFRGLEHKLKDGFKQRRSNKFGALNAVLEEQDRQFNRSFSNPDIIAEAYRRVSLNAKECAFVIGQHDAEQALSLNGTEEDSSSVIGKVIPAWEDNDNSEHEDDITENFSVCTEDSTTKKTRLRRLFGGVSGKRAGTQSRRTSM